MPDEDPAPAATAAVMVPSGLETLVRELRRRGYRTLGPVLREGAVQIADVASAAELPRGVVDEQDAGSYRAGRAGDLYFGHTTPADSWKRFLFPPRVPLWRVRREGGAMVVADSVAEAPARLALIGVRACDLEAIRIQDRVLLQGAHPDADYRARRKGAFVVAVNCGRAAASCFCASRGAGPRASAGYDLALTELGEGGHRFLVETGTDAGRDVLATLPVRPATAVDRDQAAAVVAATAASMGRAMPADVRETLKGALTSPRWEAVAGRCLSCGNCTLACPTCFCVAIEDTTDLTVGLAERTRRWDSCFTDSHSYVHGGSVRRSTAARYRQWLTHKLSTWDDQFGISGCTGCGRCITWCPAAIDITEEARALAAGAGEGRS